MIKKIKEWWKNRKSYSDWEYLLYLEAEMCIERRKLEKTRKPEDYIK